MTACRNLPDLRRGAAALLALAALALAPAASADKSGFWIALRSNLTVDKQVAEELAPLAGMIALRAPRQGPSAAYGFPEIVARLKAAGPAPVLSYAFVSRQAQSGRIEVTILQGLDIGTPLVETRSRQQGNMRFVDVTDPAVRRAVLERLLAARKELGVDGFAVDLSVRTPFAQPRALTNLCERKPGFCETYGRGMDEMIGGLNAALGEPGTVLYNGLWNFAPGMLEDQAQLLQKADAAAIEYFGMDPRATETGERPSGRGGAPAVESDGTQSKKQRERAEAQARKKAERAARQGPPSGFASHVLPYIDVLPRLPQGKPVLFFGRGSNAYTDYVEDYRWQRYLYASFLLGRRKEDLFHYHATFQVPTARGRAGGIDVYADWRLDLGEARGAYRKSGGLYEREFANGRVIVAPDDGGGGRAQLPGTLYTPEGKALSGAVPLRAGEGLILLSAPPKEPSGPAEKRVTGKQIAAWGWAGAEPLAGGQVRLKAPPAELEGEHDLLLDHTRSLAPYERLRVNAVPLDASGGILAVAEVDDPSHQRLWAVVAVGGGARAQSQRPAVPFRAPSRGEEQRDDWPQLALAFPAGAEDVVLDGPEIFARSDLRFRRWSHLRFVGSIEVRGVALSRRASPLQ